MKKLLNLLKFLFLALGLVLIIMTLCFGYRDKPLEELKEIYAPAPSQFVELDDMNVHYRDQGPVSDSIPIVLIHGTGASLHTFEKWAKGLDSSHRVISMDLPGYGLTGPFPNRDYSIQNYTSFIKDFLDVLQIKECILGGNSLGGHIAWRFTLDNPTMVEKLILIDASGYPTQSKSRPLAFRIAQIPILKQLLTFITPPFIARSSVENVYADKSKVNDALVKRYFDLTLRKGNRQAFVDRLNTEGEKSPYERVKNIQQRTLVLWGQEDKLIPIDVAKNFQVDLPNDSLVILPHVGHVPMEESPKESLDAVLSFLK